MKRILVASDLSQGSSDALERAIHFATDSGATLRIVHAHNLNASTEDRLTLRCRLDEQVRRVVARSKAAPLIYQIRLSGSEEENAILHEADSFDPDIIILGAHGEPRIRDIFLGTTATRVAQDAAHPVLIVQNFVEGPYKRLMLAVDAGSVDEAIRSADLLCPASDIYAVHVFQTQLSELFFRERELTLNERTAAILQHALEESGDEELLDRAKLRLHTMGRRGDVVSVLERSWTETRPDLVVIGTHGRSGLSKMVHGSIADEVILWCPSDILVVRHDAAGPAE